MQILRIRWGFQADHSSSSYLFYAADKPVSREGQEIAHRFSSRAEVGKRTAWYVKWGESSLAPAAYKALLSEHFDVMVSESYGWWTLILAVPKTPETEKALASLPERDFDSGVEIERYGPRLAAVVYCSFVDDGAAWADSEDVYRHLASLLVKIRQEILRGDASFLHAVAIFYGAESGEEDEGEEETKEESETPPVRPPETFPQALTKAQLQAECAKRGILVRKSWSAFQLRQALETAERRRFETEKRQIEAEREKRFFEKRLAKMPKLSRVAREIVNELDSR